MNRFQKWIDLGLGLAAVALWFLLSQMLTQVWTIFRLPLMADWPIQLPALLALVGSAGAFALTRWNARAMAFLNDVAVELSKVTWPTMQETVASTGVIIVMVGIASLLMFFFDTLWGTLTRSFLTL
jgi:preprotein translocase subunit SecE